MKIKVICLFFLSFVTLSVIADKDSHAWGYVAGKTTDPAHWPQIAKSSCGGASQSPVDIDSSQTIFDSRLPVITFQHNTKDLSHTSLVDIVLKNDGHKVSLELKNPNENIDMFFGDTNRGYRFVHIHWHWGKIDNRGSEHTVNSKAYPIEAHFVHYNNRMYDSFSQAAHSPSGLAVLGLFYEIKSTGDDSTGISELVGKFKPEFQQGADNNTVRTLEIKQFPLFQLYPKETKSYYRYSGSLTTPSCAENVLWTVLKEPQTITDEQINVFRSVQFPDGLGPMVDNFRPTLPLNPAGRNDVAKRIVTRSFANEGGIRNSWNQTIITPILCWFLLFILIQK